MSLSPPIQNLTLSDEADDTGSSPAQLNLQRLYEQSRRGAPASSKDAQKPSTPGPNAGAAAKGKPRLLLMGQRR